MFTIGKKMILGPVVMVRVRGKSPANDVSLCHFPKSDLSKLMCVCLRVYDWEKPA